MSRAGALPDFEERQRDNLPPAQPHEWGVKVMELREQITRILESQKLAYLATSDGRWVDNAVVCFSYDHQPNLYFGSFSDTVKCRNMKANPLVAHGSSGTTVRPGAKCIVTH